MIRAQGVLFFSCFAFDVLLEYLCEDVLLKVFQPSHWMEFGIWN